MDVIGNNLAEKLQKLQNREARIHFECFIFKTIERSLKRTRLADIKRRKHKQKAIIMMFNILNGMAPAYMEDLFKQETGLNVYNLRASRKNIVLFSFVTYRSFKNMNFV